VSSEQWAVSGEQWVVSRTRALVDGSDWKMKNEKGKMIIDASSCFSLLTVHRSPLTVLDLFFSHSIMKRVAG